jgi:hypothetical protein
MKNDYIMPKNKNELNQNELIFRFKVYHVTFCKIEKIKIPKERPKRQN